jgi:histone H2B
MAKAKTRRRSEPTYASYIHRVMKQVHPDLQISSKAIMATNALIDALLEDLTKNGVKVAVASKKGTLSARHVQSAVKLVFPDELAKHATSEGTKAVTKFTAH